MKKKELEMALEHVPRFKNPDPSLEQYMTPATIAADILFYAYMNGDVEDMKVVDLGCGTGMFSVGAWLLNAGMVTGYDISETAIRTAGEYIESINADIGLHVSDIRDVHDVADTVFMNPPFGCQTRRADRAFLEKAIDISECVYSIHMASTFEFVKEYVNKRGRNVTYHKTYKYNIPHTFGFHKEEKHSVDIVVVNIR